MHPWRAGQDAVLPEALVKKLIASGEAKDPRPYPPPDVLPAAAEEKTPELKPSKPYFTRKRG
jgi:hypothetical protein